MIRNVGPLNACFRSIPLATPDLASREPAVLLDGRGSRTGSRKRKKDSAEVKPLFLINHVYTFFLYSVGNSSFFDTLRAVGAVVSIRSFHLKLWLRERASWSKEPEMQRRKVWLGIGAPRLFQPFLIHFTPLHTSDSARACSPL